MGLKYDFDIVTIAPDDIDLEQDQPEASGGGTAGAGVTPGAYALFRDVKTADALRAASPKIREMFLNAGFKLATYDSGAPHGYYPSDDAPQRERIIKQLFSNIRKTGLRGEYCGEFSFIDFLQYVRSAKPFSGFLRKQQAEEKSSALPSPAKPKRRAVPARIGFALGLAVLLFVIFKYLASLGAG